MKYTIITDSSCNVFATEFNSQKVDLHVVPMTLILDGKEFVDTENLNVQEFVAAMSASKTVKSACPSPEAFFDIMKKGDNIIVLSISSRLSGAHQSATIAAQMLKEKYPKKKVHIADSLSAACGLDLMLFRLRDIIEKSEKPFSEITAYLDDIIKTTRVRFLLQDLSNLTKNGRLGKVTGKLLTIASIKLICGDNGDGEIKKYAMALGTRRGLQTLAEMPTKTIDKDSLIIVNHVNNEGDAIFLVNLLQTKFGFTNVITRGMRATASMYAANKGISMAY